MVILPLCIELCVYIARRSAWRAMKKCTSSVEGNYVVSNYTDLKRVSNIIIKDYAISLSNNRIDQFINLFTLNLYNC